MIDNSLGRDHARWQDKKVGRPAERHTHEADRGGGVGWEWMQVIEAGRLEIRINGGSTVAISVDIFCAVFC
jgi:hypothetical protein